MSSDRKPEFASLSELPRDELLSYGRGLGLDLEENTPEGELLRRIRGRQELLIELDREALLDVVIWARRPVRQSASKEELARHIVEIQRGRFEGLSPHGLVALARLRGIAVSDETDREAVVAALKKAEGLWSKVRRKRRTLAGTLVAKLIHEDSEDHVKEYQFLPEDGGPSLRKHIEEEGMVGGIARKLRGVADDYVHEKLDEIEERIDRKLDEIDKRLGEWRDREVSNRLKILKITLIVSILVALLGLGYDYLRSSLHEQASSEPAAVSLLDGEFSRPTSTRVENKERAGNEHQHHVRTTEQAG